MNGTAWEELSGWIRQGRWDVLFVAETWYLKWNLYSRSPYLLAATAIPPVLDQRRRHTGGLLALGTAQARRRLTGVVAATELGLVLQFGAWTVAGLYLAPSLPPKTVLDYLTALPPCTVVIGDVNVRFGHPRYRDRETALVTWLGEAGLLHVQPETTASPGPAIPLHPRLELDHCFARRPGHLWLVSLQALRLESDHRYLLDYALDDRYLLHDALEGDYRPSLRATLLLRFRIARLTDPQVQRRLQRRWERLAPRDIDWTGVRTVDALDRRLVAMCQRVARDVLGYRGQRCMSKEKQVQARAGGGASLSRGRTYQLVRRILQLDRANGPLLPTQPGRDALDEANEAFQHQFAGSTPDPMAPTAQEARPSYAGLGYAGLGHTRLAISGEMVRQLLAEQDARKACGWDGLHMLLLKTLAPTSFADHLAELYTTCWRDAETPRDWNRADVHLLVKDPTVPKTIHNVRPITLIVMFRKVFELLLLRRFDTGPRGWAAVHPMQAGFRRTDSTLTHAALLHILLEAQWVDTAVFLDFQKAFDCVNYARLEAILAQRGCPVRLRCLLRRLMWDGVVSHVHANDATSLGFRRGRGLLQGSPLSPALFNLYVDDLLYQLNEPGDPVPTCLFFADDGVLLAKRGRPLQPLMDTVQTWVEANGMALNVLKCGVMSRRTPPLLLQAGDQFIPVVQEYRYLGFPVRMAGLDFAQLVQERIDRARRRAVFFSDYSTAWPPVHRLRIYQGWLAPQIEYGAPLVWAWAQSNPSTKRAWKEATRDWGELIGWIANSRANPHVTANLLGLTSLDLRFRELHAMFQWQMERIPETHPLRRLLRFAFCRPFPYQLRKSELFEDWKRNRSMQETKASLSQYIRRRRWDDLVALGETLHLLRLIPSTARLRQEQYGADGVLLADAGDQGRLLQYRRGVWGMRRRHVCNADGLWHRGDEECQRCFGPQCWLTRQERKDQRRLAETLNGKVTIVDLLLNQGQHRRAAEILRWVEQRWHGLESIGDGSC